MDEEREHEAEFGALKNLLQQILNALARIEHRLENKATKIVFLVKVRGKTQGGNTMVSLDPVNNAYDITVTGELDANGKRPGPPPRFSPSGPTR